MLKMAEWQTVLPLMQHDLLIVDHVLKNTGDRHLKSKVITTLTVCSIATITNLLTKIPVLKNAHNM